MERSRQFSIAPQQSGRKWLSLATTKTGLVDYRNGRGPLRACQRFDRGAKASLELSGQRRRRQCRSWLEGINDLGRGHTVDSIKAGYQSIVAKLHAHRIKVTSALGLLNPAEGWYPGYTRGGQRPNG